MKIEICILCKNELKSFRKIYFSFLKIIKKNGLNFFIMDGNSTDGLVNFYKKNNIKYYTQNIPGRGSAIIEAFQLKKKIDALIFFSPDGNEDPRDLIKFVNYIKSYDLVIASRMMKEGVNEEDNKIFRFRKWANLVFNFLANFFFNKRNKYITDSINGYRAIRADIFKKLNCDEAGYAIEYQMTIRALKADIKIREFPTIENNRIAGISQAPSISTGFTFIRCLLKELIKKFF